MNSIIINLMLDDQQFKVEFERREKIGDVMKEAERRFSLISGTFALVTKPFMILKDQTKTLEEYNINEGNDLMIYVISHEQ
jgi:hypothetical protein